MQNEPTSPLVEQIILAVLMLTRSRCYTVIYVQLLDIYCRLTVYNGHAHVNGGLINGEYLTSIDIFDC